MPSITVQADGAEEKFALEAAVVTIGRGLESDIRIKDIKASRRHCQVVKAPQGFKLLDLGSGNGTFVNGIQVREQALKTGDKIQIGQTVIVFENSMEQKPAARTGTASLPKVGAARKGETARIATGQTKRTEAVKPVATSTPQKTGTARMPTATAKPATARAATATGKTATSRIEKKTTGRATTGTGRVPTQRTTGGTRIPKKKNNPMIIVGVGVVVLAGLIGALAFAGVFTPSLNMEIINRDLRVITEEAAKLEEANKYDEAIAAWTKAIKFIDDNGAGDIHKSAKSDFKSRIKGMEDAKKEDQRVEDGWRQWKAKYDKIGGEGGIDKLELMKDAKELTAAFGQKPWFQEFVKFKEQLQLMINSDRAADQMKDIQFLTNNLNTKYKFADRTVGMWGPAIKEFKEYLKTAGSSDKPKAEQRILECEGRAKDALSSFSKKAESMKSGGEDAHKFLQEKKPQFEGAAVEAEFVKLMESYKP